jgi:integrase/recombinase XerD
VNDDELIARALEVLQARAAGSTRSTLSLAELYSRYEDAKRVRVSDDARLAPGPSGVAARRKVAAWRAISDRLGAFVAMYAQRDVQGLKVLDWSDYRTVRAKTEIPSGKRGRFYCDNTINQELRTLKAMLGWAVAEGRITYNPLAAAKAVKTRTTRSTAPSETDVGELLGKADPLRTYLVLAGSDAGMRRNEMLHLRHDWIDRDRMQATLEGWCCKGNKPRTVPITSRLLAAIDALPRRLRSPYVLTNPETGDPYNRDTLSKWFRVLADSTTVQAAAEDGRVRLHDDRHGFARNSAKRGVRVEVIQEMLGHSNIATTMIYVGKVDHGDVSDARETFEAGILRDQERRPAKRAEPAVTDTPRSNRNDGQS